MDDSFSDDDFSDVGESPVEEAVRAKKNGSKVSGPDKSWLEVARFLQCFYHLLWVFICLLKSNLDQLL